MNASIWSLAIAFALDVLYVGVSVFKKRRRPSLFPLFVLFLVGAVVTEAIDVLSITFRLAALKEQLDLGVFKDHVFVIAFTGVALLYAAADSVNTVFKTLLNAP